MNYYTTLSKHSPGVRDTLITEAHHTRFGNTPEELKWLTGGIADLGFENLGLDEKSFKNIMLGFTQNGLAIPGTGWKMRAAANFKAVIEPVTPGERIPELPANWAQAVLVIDLQSGDVLYAGDLVRPDQLPPGFRS